MTSSHRSRQWNSYASGGAWPVDEWVSGEMNLRRGKCLAVMDAVERGEVATLVVAHHDRLARFGFDFVEHVAALSCRLYGLGRYEKTLKEELTGGGR